MINLKAFCDKCRIVYQIGLIEYLFNKKGCPICKEKKYRFALGHWDKIR
jgi:hypothetical protein